MNGTSYRCIWCGKDTTLCFADDYKPFQRWLMSCLKCGKYGLHNLMFADSYPVACGVGVETRPR